MRHLILLVLSLVAITGRAAEEFRTVPLTSEEIISIYKVPVEEQPSYKYEWTFPGEKYVRYVLEETDRVTENWKKDGNYHWTITSAVPCTTPLKVATFIYTIRNRELKDKKDGRNFWQINVRFGGTGSALTVWAQYSLDLELPETGYTMAQSINDPGMVFLFQGQVRQGPSKIYRLRLESSDHPFPERN